MSDFVMDKCGEVVIWRGYRYAPTKDRCDSLDLQVLKSSADMEDYFLQKGRSSYYEKLDIWRLPSTSIETTLQDIKSLTEIKQGIVHLTSDQYELIKDFL